MIRRIAVVVLVLIGLWSCGKSNQLSVSEEKMIAILVDVHLAEAALHNLNNVQKDSFSQIYYQQIFKIHDITKEQYTSDIDYLKQNPAEMRDLYEIVLENLGEQEANLDQINRKGLDDEKKKKEKKDE